MTDKTDSKTQELPVSEGVVFVRCGNCDGSGYDLTGLKGAGGKAYNRVCHVCDDEYRRAAQPKEKP